LIHNLLIRYFMVKYFSIILSALHVHYVITKAWLRSGLVQQRRCKNEVEMAWVHPQMDIQAIFLSSLTSRRLRKTSLIFEIARPRKKLYCWC
jgi:hypothetical protein